jgi:hypothetical protein
MEGGAAVGNGLRWYSENHRRLGRGGGGKGGGDQHIHRDWRRWVVAFAGAAPQSEGAEAKAKQAEH